MPQATTPRNSTKRSASAPYPTPSSVTKAKRGRPKPLNGDTDMYSDCVRYCPRSLPPIPPPSRIRLTPAPKFDRVEATALMPIVCGLPSSRVGRRGAGYLIDERRFAGTFTLHAYPTSLYPLPYAFAVQYSDFLSTFPPYYTAYRSPLSSPSSLCSCPPFSLLLPIMLLSFGPIPLSVSFFVVTLANCAPPHSNWVEYRVGLAVQEREREKLPVLFSLLFTFSLSPCHPPIFLRRHRQWPSTRIRPGLCQYDTRLGAMNVRRVLV
ncbi:hypothetical protein NMY22_g6414 [Coprinellus aureogranulatus]|nr:hypothetical protein NMY22_g6414 [Coprinellus aureogranulatus]